MLNRRAFAVHGLVTLILAMPVLPWPAAAQATSPTRAGGIVIETDAGAIAGYRDGTVDHFLGIPYAASPIGERRWRPPQAVEAWSGVRDAVEYGNRCPAAESSNGPRTETEDCLFINVQRPAGIPTGAGLPVYVFIHGGGLVNGSSNQADMAAIVEQTGIIGVTLNYRLGALGFLAHPALTRESGNYGLLDQQAALRWVQTNIAAFGGDPERVTIGGESAGGWSVCAHLVSPGSAGLFSQAMLQSASCPSVPIAEAEAIGTVLADGLGCPAGDDTLTCLRDLPVSALIDSPYPGAPLPVHGTAFLPRPVREAIASGDFARVPVVIGANRDEGRTFAAGNTGWSRKQYEAWVRQTFAETADAVLAEYPWPADAGEYTGAYLSGAILTDSGLLLGIGGCTNRQLSHDFARHTDTYAFEFAHRTGPGLAPGPGGYEWGAGHAAELAYLFPSFDNGTPIAPTFDAGEQMLASTMKTYWGSFVTNGSPDAQGLRPWPLFNEDGGVLSLRAGDETVVISDTELADEHHCGFWDALNPLPSRR